MKKKDLERLEIATADIKTDIEALERFLIETQHPARHEVRVKLNQLWLSVHDLEYFIRYS